jgi:hypothetical protein
MLSQAGYQRPEDFDVQKAISFSKKFPLYLSLCNVILAQLKSGVDQIDKSLERLCANLRHYDEEKGPRCPIEVNNAPQT